MAYQSILSQDPSEFFEWDDRSTLALSEPEAEPLYLEIPQGNHLFFDEDGNEISHEQFLQLQEEENSWAFGYKLNGNEFIFRHPTALLSFFRFVDSVNQYAEFDETIFIRPLRQEMYSRMIDHPYFQTTTDESHELLTYMARNSELV
jgi:hypothetical protein